MKKLFFAIAAALLLNLSAIGQQPVKPVRVGFDTVRTNIAYGDIDTITYTSKTYSEHPGGHSWPVRRNNLYNFAQVLFK